MDPQAGVADTPSVYGLSSSQILTCTELGLPAVTEDGSVPSDTVKVSSSSSASWFVETGPVPVVWPAAIEMEASVPTSPDSAVFGVVVETVTGIVTGLESALESLAVTVTDKPSVTCLGADSETVGRGACRVTVTV